MATLIKSTQTTFANGWTPANETWTYASADDPTFTFTIAGVDLTTKYSAGMRIKLTQTTVKYFIITAVAFSTNTTITVYGGTDYDLANATITDPFYSMVKAPQGFPLDPTKWTVELSDTQTLAQANPTDTTWYNLGSLSLSIPIGVWVVQYSVVMNITSDAANTYATMDITLSTANNSESSNTFTYKGYFGGAIATWNIVTTFEKEKVLSLTSKASYYLNARGDATMSNMQYRGTLAPTIIRAISVYL